MIIGQDRSAARYILQHKEIGSTDTSLSDILTGKTETVLSGKLTVNTDTFSRGILIEKS